MKKLLCSLELFKVALQKVRKGSELKTSRKKMFVFLGAVLYSEPIHQALHKTQKRRLWYLGINLWVYLTHEYKKQ